jgi:hypothetical protein
MSDLSANSNSVLFKPLRSFGVIAGFITQFISMPDATAASVTIEKFLSVQVPLLRRDAEVGEVDRGAKILRDMLTTLPSQSTTQPAESTDRQKLQLALAGLYVASEKWPEAEVELRSALAMVSKTGSVIDIIQFQLAKVLMERKLWPEARELLAQVMISNAPQVVRLEATVLRIC